MNHMEVDYNKSFKGSNIMLKGVQLPSKADLGTVYFVHGLSGRWKDYKPLLEPLSDAFDVRAYDQRGHGKSPGVYNFESATDDLESILEDEDRKPAGILGHSLGCRSAIEVAKRFERKGKPLGGIYLLEPCLGIESISQPKQKSLLKLKKYAPLLAPLDLVLNLLPFIRVPMGLNQRYVTRTLVGLTEMHSSECRGIKQTPAGYMLADNDSILGNDNQLDFSNSMNMLKEVFQYQTPEVRAIDDSGVVAGLNHCFNYKGHRPFLKNEQNKDSNQIVRKIADFFYTAFAKS